MSRIFIAGVFVAMAVSTSHAQNFVGRLEFVPTGCEATRDCKLKADFGFLDGAGTGWQAKAGDKTDGATIPDWAQPHVGKPFEPAFIKAAVIHDHYCARRVRPWLATHRAFYEALLASGVPKVKSKVMYYAVLVGGPKWIFLEPPQDCTLGRSCIMQVETAILPGDGAIISDDGKRLFVRGARYNDPKIKQEIASAAKLIEEQAASITLDQLVERAKRFSPSDVFLSSGPVLRAKSFSVGIDR